MGSNYPGVIFQHNFVPVTNQPVTRSMTASSSTSICNPTPTKKTMVTNSDNSQLTLVSPYKNYVYHNAKAFRESTSITNSQIENIWDHYFDKKNKGFCQNCDIYPISRPVNTRMRNTSWRVPPGIIVETGRDTTINTDKYTFVCYICYNEHLVSKTSILDATAPMDTREGGVTKVEDSYFNHYKTYSK